MTDSATSQPPGRTVESSRITISQLMQPEQANIMGDVHGGWIMKLVDEAGALAAMRHSQCRVVTVAIDQMSFHEPIRIGDLVMLSAELTYVGRTSMETRVRVVAEDPMSGQKMHTTTAYVVYVALDENSRPKPVPPLIAETEAQIQRMREGEARQTYRRAQLIKEVEEDQA
ncbi:MAG: acyl-CoA thioesterase [Anaerolineales bacterium]